MTDDSTAERNALREAFPSSKLYLCIFHFLQALWRWLFETDHGVSKNDRQEIFEAFRKIAYAENTDDFNSAKESMENLPSFQNNGKLIK